MDFSLRAFAFCPKCRHRGGGRGSDTNPVDSRREKEEILITTLERCNLAPPEGAAVLLLLLLLVALFRVQQQQLLAVKMTGRTRKSLCCVRTTQQ